MSAQELHDLFVKFSNFGDIHDFSQVWNEVKSLFKDDHKQNVNQYEIPEILKDLPLVNEEQSDAKLLNELMELDSTESNDMAGELGNTFRRLEIVQIDHVNSQVKFFEFAPTTYTYDGFSFSDVHEKFELDADIFTFQPYQSDDVNITAWKVSQEKQVIFDDAPKIPEIVAIIEEVAPIIEEVAPIVEEVAPIVEEVAPIVEEVAPIVEEVAPIVEEVVPVVQNDKPIFPLVVIPAAENVVAQEKARLPYKVFNVHPDRGPFQSDTVYLLRGIDPREAPQMNHKHGKMSASMEITHEDKISVEPAILSPVVPVAQPRPKFAISAEQFAKQKQLIQEKASKESVEEIPESTQQQTEVETFVSELVEDKSKVEAPQIEAVIPQRPKFAISAEQFAKQKQLIQEKASKESVEEIPESTQQQTEVETFVSELVEDKSKVEAPQIEAVIPQRPKFAISAEQFAKQKQLIQEKASKESVEEIPESTQQQAEVETFVSELVEDKSKVEAPQIEAVIPQRPKFAISAEQFAKQKQLIQEKATKESVEETPESTQQQTEVETFVSELVEDESNTRESLTVEEKQAVDAFVSEIINEQSNDVTSFTPPPLPPPLPVSTKVTKTWAPVETATGETSKKQEPKATKTVFAISANEFVTGAKQLKRVTVEKHSAEKGKDSGDGVKNLLFKAMENVSARTEGGKYSAKHVDEEDADIDNFWENEEKEEALIATNTALIRETISQKLNSVSFQEKLSIDLQELVRSKSPVIKTAIELYHARLSADIKVDSEKSIKIESKISEMLEKIDLLIKQQLTSHGDKSSKSYYAENMAELLVHKINLKESIEASVVEKLLAQFDHDLQVKMYDKVKIEMGTILSEETKYLSKTEGLNTSESYSKFAVDQLSKNLMADKDVIKDIVHDGDDQSVESKPVDTQPIQSSLAAALQLRRVGIADDQEEDEEDSDWEDEDPTSQSLPISQEKVVVKEFAKSMVDHKSEDVANGALETKKSSTVLSTQEIAEVESFVKDITKKGSSLSMADMIQSPDEIPGLQEGGGSIIEGKQDISSFQPVAVCNAVMMQQEVLPQVALAHFE